MSYDPNFPANDGLLADFPEGYREQIRALVEDAVIDALKVQGLAPGNASGNIPINNGTKNQNLNADMLGGKYAADFAASVHSHSAATPSMSGYMTGPDKTKLDGIATGAEVNQNAFGSVLIGDTTIQADAQTDTLEIVAGANIALTPDATNDRVTIAVTGKVPSASYADSAGAAPANGGNAATVGGYSASGLAKTGMAYTAAQVNNASLDAGIYAVENSSIAGIPDNYVHVFSSRYSAGGYGAQLLIPYANGTYNGVYYRVATGATYGAPKRLIEEGDSRLTNARPASGGTSEFSGWTSRLNANTHGMGTYNVQSDWTGTYWRLRGYSGDTYHAGCQVAFADSAGSIPWSGVDGKPTIPVDVTAPIIDYTVPADTNSVTISGLDINAAGGKYRVVFQNPVITANTVFMGQINGDTNDANYTGILAGIGNNGAKGLICYQYGANRLMAELHMHLVNNYFAANGTNYNEVSAQNIVSGMGHRGVISNVTSFTLKTETGTNNIKAGAKIKVYLR